MLYIDNENSKRLQNNNEIRYYFNLKNLPKIHMFNIIKDIKIVKK